MNDPPSPSAPPAVSLGQRLRRVHKLLSPFLMGSMAGEMQDLELSFNAMRALFHLRATARLSISEVAESTHLSVPAASHMVERLVRRGLVERREDPANRRQKVLTLGAGGRALLERFESATADGYARVFADVPEDVLVEADRALAVLLTHLPEEFSSGPAASACPPDVRPAPSSDAPPADLSKESA